MSQGYTEDYKTKKSPVKKVGISFIHYRHYTIFLILNINIH